MTYHLDEELRELRDKIQYYLELGDNSYLKEARITIYQAGLQELDDLLYHLVCLADEGKITINKQGA